MDHPGTESIFFHSSGRKKNCRVSLWGVSFLEFNSKRGEDGKGCVLGIQRAVSCYDSREGTTGTERADSPLSHETVSCEGDERADNSRGDVER